MSRRPDPVASRHAILAAARDCFSATGYAGTSMHDIAAAAGVTQSLIHHHFGPKDALWAEVRRHAFGQYVAQQRAVVEAVAREPDHLREALEAYFRFLAQRPDVLRLVAWLELEQAAAGPVEAGLLAMGAELRAELRALHEEGVRVIEALQAQGRVRRDQPARFVLVALLGLVRNWFEERNLVQDESDPQQVAEVDAAYLQTLWSAVREGLVARAPVRIDGQPAGQPGIASPAGPAA
jgi:TetR/AcrR family transcriptional regulator